MLLNWGSVISDKILKRSSLFANLVLQQRKLISRKLEGFKFQKMNNKIGSYEMHALGNTECLNPNSTKLNRESGLFQTVTFHIINHWSPFQLKSIKMKIHNIIFHTTDKKLTFRQACIEL